MKHKLLNLIIFLRCLVAWSELSAEEAEIKWWAHYKWEPVYVEDINPETRYCDVLWGDYSTRLLCYSPKEFEKTSFGHKYIIPQGWIEINIKHSYEDWINKNDTNPIIIYRHIICEAANDSDYTMRDNLYLVKTKYKITKLGDYIHKLRYDLYRN